MKLLSASRACLICAWLTSSPSRACSLYPILTLPLGCIRLFGVQCRAASQRFLVFWKAGHVGETSLRMRSAFSAFKMLRKILQRHVVSHGFSLRLDEAGYLWVSCRS